jgi:hypothetical protein
VHSSWGHFLDLVQVQNPEPDFPSRRGTGSTDESYHLEHRRGKGPGAATQGVQAYLQVQQRFNEASQEKISSLKEPNNTTEPLDEQYQKKVISDYLTCG